MTFAGIRHTLFTLHLWVGLVLGLVLAVIGLSGSILVYDETLTRIFDGPPQARTAGQRLPLSMLARAGQSAAAQSGVWGGPVQILLPQAPGEVATVRVMQDAGVQHSHAPRMPGGGLQVFVDPVSGQVLGSRAAGLPPVFAFLHQFHGSLKLGREVGRPIVGWMGVAMLVLGVSGLVLWWPKRGQWKYAFFVRPTARGLRFHRELHAATGIWIFIAFMAVSFSGVAITFPQAVRAMLAPGSLPPRPIPRDGPVVAAIEGARRLTPDAAILVAQKAMPGLAIRSVSLPQKPDQAIAVGLVSAASTTALVYIDPYRGTVLASRNPIMTPGIDSFMAYQRPMHDGTGLGQVWRFLVFLSGLAPALFMVTGTIMWLKKRRRRVPMTMMTDEIPD